MTRVPLVNIDNLSGPVGDALRARPTRKLHILRMMAHADSCVVQQLQLGSAINTDQDLNPLFRELLVLLTAHLDGGEYVWRQHVPIALRLGATPQMIDAIERGDLTSDAFSADQRSLMAFGLQVVRGGIMDGATFGAAQSRHSNRELVEAILAIGYYMTMNRLTSATQTPLEVAAVDPRSPAAPGSQAG